MSEDPRLGKDGLCRVTFMNGKTEMICAREVHQSVYHRRSTNPTHPKGEVFSSNPNADFHYFVNRYPYRDMEKIDANDSYS